MVEQTATVLAGETYIDVAHGAASTPVIDDFSINPKDDLGGRSWWIDPIDATNFRLNISSMDMANHVFGWRLLSQTYTVTAGRYGVLNVVKNLCLIDLSEVSFDTQLDLTIKAADNIINNELHRCAVTVPLTIVPDIIVDISNYLAAGLFKQKDIPDEKVHSFYTIGKNLLDAYINTNYPGFSEDSEGVSIKDSNQTLSYGVGLAV